MGLELKIGQVQKISQNMIQQVNVLQMSAQELTEYVKEMSMENPLMDLEEPEPESPDQERLRKLEWLSDMDEQNRIYYRQEHEESEESGIADRWEEEEETLSESLLQQLLGGPYTDIQMEIFRYLAESLDSRGYFVDPVSEAACHLGVGEADVARCLEVMKTLEPAGVCAADLSECLYLQLERREGAEELSVEKAIVREYLQLLGKNQLPAIARRLEVPIERIQKAKKVIQGLNPKPASGYADRGGLRYITPDVTVVKLADYFEIMVNEYVQPQIRLNKDYMKLLRGGECEKEVQQYLSEKVKQIEQVQDFITKRNRTLTRLARFLVEEQKEFFQHGKGHLHPLRMRDAAEKLEIHESTVSRAVKEKYLQCCWGVFPLEYFFTRGLGEKEGCETIATDQILEVLKEIIAEEDKRKPYSDQKLALQLASRGITISRRTVAKYREGLQIPDCRGRKEYSSTGKL